MLGFPLMARQLRLRAGLLNIKRAYESFEQPQKNLWTISSSWFEQRIMSKVYNVPMTIAEKPRNLIFEAWKNVLPDFGFPILQINTHKRHRQKVKKSKRNQRRKKMRNLSDRKKRQLNY